MRVVSRTALIGLILPIDPETVGVGRNNVGVEGGNAELEPFAETGQIEPCRGDPERGKASHAESKPSRAQADGASIMNRRKIIGKSYETILGIIMAIYCENVFK